MLFNPEDRFEVEVHGEEYVILRERDIHAIASQRNDSGRGCTCERGPKPCPRDRTEGVPLTVDEELVHAGRLRQGADGLVPAIVQDATDGTVLTVAYMDAEALRRTLESGRIVVLQPQPPGVLAEGRDLGRPPVRARGAHGLRRRRARGAGRPARARGLPHRRADAASTAPSAPARGARAVTAGGDPGPAVAGAWPSAPTPPSSPRWPRSTPSCPVWCEVVADTLTPVACLRQRGRATGTASSSSRSRAASAGAATPSWAGARWPR